MRIFINFVFAVFLGVTFGLSFVSYKAFKSIDIEYKENLKLTKKYGEFSDKKDLKYNPIFRLSNKGEHKFWCSAYVVDKNYAFTAAHCLVDEANHLVKETLTAINDQGEETNVELKAVGVMSRSDMGLISGDFSDFKHIQIDATEFNLFPGHLYFACGFPYGQKKMSCNPIIPKTNSNSAIVAEGILIGGMSGGPVLDVDKNGIPTVVGFNSATLGDGGVIVYPLQGILGAFHLE